jgi:hypothetical protein
MDPAPPTAARRRAGSGRPVRGRAGATRLRRRMGGRQYRRRRRAPGDQPRDVGRQGGTGAGDRCPARTRNRPRASRDPTRPAARLGHATRPGRRHDPGLAAAQPGSTVGRPGARLPPGARLCHRPRSLVRVAAGAGGAPDRFGGRRARPLAPPRTAPYPHRMAGARWPARCRADPRPHRQLTRRPGSGARARTGTGPVARPTPAVRGSRGGASNGRDRMAPHRQSGRLAGRPRRPHPCRSADPRRSGPPSQAMEIGWACPSYRGRSGCRRASTSPRVHQPGGGRHGLETMRA